MHTFDNKLAVGDPGIGLDEIIKSDLPDEHEIGETNETWLFVRRSTGMIEIVSKHTGVVIAKCYPQEATTYGISEAQVKAALGVLAL